MKSEPGFMGADSSSQNAPANACGASEQASSVAAGDVLKLATDSHFCLRWWEADWFKEWERLARPQT
jgi:hypothetical protein